jgi:hypothetical protein
MAHDAEYHEKLSNATAKGVDALTAIREYISCLMLLGNDISVTSIAPILNGITLIQDLNGSLETLLRFKREQLNIKESWQLNAPTHSQNAPQAGIPIYIEKSELKPLNP